MRKPPARERKPHRTFEKRRKPKLVRRAKPRPMFLVARPRVMQLGVPSLPAMPRQDDGREHQYRSRLMMLSRAMADLAADANAFRSRKALPLSATQTVHGTDLHRGIVYTVP